MTSVIRWSSRPRDPFRNDVDQLFDSLLQFRPRRLNNDVGGGTAGRAWLASFSPSVDIEESKDEFVITADLPGVDPKDAKVNILGDTLTIRGQRKDREERNGHDVHRVERAYGTFERSFTLGVPVQSDKVRASYRDGVLEIRIPKAEAAKVKEIEVQVGS